MAIGYTECKLRCKRPYKKVSVYLQSVQSGTQEEVVILLAGRREKTGGFQVGGADKGDQVSSMERESGRIDLKAGW